MHVMPERLANAYIAVRAVIANTVVGQMLPEGAVKGGGAIKLRLGNASAHFMTDLDVGQHRKFSLRQEGVLSTAANARTTGTRNHLHQH